MCGPLSEFTKVPHYIETHMRHLLAALVNSRAGTIQLSPDSILSRYLGADTAGITIFFKNCDLILRFFIFNTRPSENVKSYT